MSDVDLKESFTRVVISFADVFGGVTNAVVWAYSDNAAFGDKNPVAYALESNEKEAKVKSVLMKARAGDPESVLVTTLLNPKYE